MFIIFLMFILVAVDYLYSISDQIVGGVNTTINSMGYTNSLSTLAYTYYGRVRDIIYTGITGILVPFLIFLSFVSSFLNRNQDFTSYLVAALATIFITPLILFIFPDILTNLLNVSILDTAYMSTIYLTNLTFILVVNMLLSLASFVFIIRQRGVTI